MVEGESPRVIPLKGHTQGAARGIGERGYKERNREGCRGGQRGREVVASGGVIVVR